MRNNPSLVTNVLSHDKLTMYDLEVRKFHTDSSVKDPVKGTRIDTWWTGIVETGKYPTFTKLVMAVLSCFHGQRFALTLLCSTFENLLL